MDIRRMFTYDYNSQNDSDEEGRDDVIYYKSSDGNIVTPSKTDVFGANIVSNNYIGGQGIISFDGPVTSIGSTFANCSSLTSITIPDSVIEIGNHAFYKCTSLTSVNIPDSVTEIRNHAFMYCRSLTSVTIPNSVTAIGTYAFARCSNLTSVYCKATTPPVGGSSMFFRNNSSRKIYVPMESVEAYESAEYWSEYADAIVDYDF